jgi:trans-aconitate methyltransferase
MQKWNPEQYAQHARFVSDLGGPVVDLLDLGCGDGTLTERLVSVGC